MKTITVDYKEYKEELESEYTKGYRHSGRRLYIALNAFIKKDFKEAEAILLEDYETDGIKIFDKLKEINGDACTSA